MKNTLLPSAAYHSGHGTGLPFSGMTIAARTNYAAQDADVPGSPPRGGPV